MTLLLGCDFDVRQKVQRTAHGGKGVPPPHKSKGDKAAAKQGASDQLAD